MNQPPTVSPCRGARVAHGASLRVRQELEPRRTEHDQRLIGCAADVAAAPCRADSSTPSSGDLVDILAIAIVVFAVIETLNILILYFRPGSRLGNGMGVFDAYRKAEADPETRELARYLVNWVAGTKLIFVGLLVVIVVTGSQTTKAWAIVALILSILSFFWRLFPAIVRLDRANQVTPRGYSTTLGVMIAGFVGGLAAALAVSVALGSGG